ncbi:MAG TPA: RNA polymerase sigma factor [Solirubrobacteraceae bacterium]|jgi:RNA polymerase sigma factor (sigma-70 family)|nr:RNA polymerase sigma factor [Solirubrobacteraceae bacterium]
MPPFQRFMQEHGDAVWRLLLANLPRQEAEDCFQETFLAALRAYEALSADANERAWVLTIAHRKVIDAYRARGRRALPMAEVPERAVPPPAPGGDEELWSRVRALPPKQRAAVTLRFVGDLAHAEVAQALGCSEEAARRSLHEGLTRLRREVTK